MLSNKVWFRIWAVQIITLVALLGSVGIASASGLSISQEPGLPGNFTLKIESSAWADYDINSTVTLKVYQRYTQPNVELAEGNYVTSVVHEQSITSNSSIYVPFSDQLAGTYEYGVWLQGGYIGGHGGYTTNIDYEASLEVVREIYNVDYEVLLSRYDIFYGDFNNDGSDSDIYFHPKKRFVPIAGEIFVPLFIDGGYGFVFYTSIGGYRQIEPLKLTATELIEIGAVPAVLNTDYFEGDINGDGRQDLFLRGATSSGKPLVVLQTNVGYPDYSVPAIDSNTYFNPSDRSLTLTLRDENRDGRADLVWLSQPGGYVMEIIFSTEAGKLNASEYRAVEIGEIFNISTFPTTTDGALGGAFNVSASGTATYTVPIYTPAGTAGVTPSASFNYSSQGDNGNMGVGWSFSAAGAITRCGQSLAVDGKSLPITFGTDDRLCLDGRRLVLSSGGQYGADGATYVPEIGSGLWVKQHGSLSSAGSYFSVIGKDGSLSYFGEAPGVTPSVDASRKALTAGTLTWNLVRKEDNAGNPIHYIYEQDSNGANQRLSRIDYAYGKGTTALASIEFQYEKRPDPFRGYYAGSSVVNELRLREVNVFNTVSTKVNVRNYYIYYSLEVAGRERSPSYVAAIQECVANSCKAATQFGWDYVTGSFASSPSNNIVLGLDGNQSLRDFKLADINGDGVQDLLWLVMNITDEGLFEPANPDHRLYYAIATESGFQKAVFTDGSSYLDFSENEKSKIRMETLDYNLDGRMDIALFRDRGSNAKKWEVYVSTPGVPDWRLSSSPTFLVDAGVDAAFVDVNADGVVDIVDGESFYTLEVDTSKDISSNTYYKFSNAQNFDWLDAGGNYDPESLIETGYNYCENNPYDSRRRYYAWGDFNGDGRMDAVGGDYLSIHKKTTRSSCTGSVELKEHLYVLFNTPSGFKQKYDLGERVSTSASPSTLKYDFEDKYFSAVDVNADGLSDLLVRESKMLNVYISSGDGFLPPQKVADLHWDKSQLQYQDVNNDGFFDVVEFGSINSDFSYAYTHLWINEDIGYSTQAGGPYVGDTAGDARTRFTFGDANGDGLLDKIRFHNGEIDVFLHDTSTGVANEIVKIDSGEGNQTKIEYQSINRSSHYARLDASPEQVDETEYCRLNGAEKMFSVWCFDVAIYSADTFYEILNSGLDDESQTELVNDAPVMEFNGAYRVVTNASSLAPSVVLGNDAYTSDGITGAATRDENSWVSVGYRYGQAKIQGGGRGFLGFRTLTEIDDQSGTHVTTVYRQDYPFIGSPLSTYRYSPSGELTSESHNIYGIVGTNPGVKLQIPSATGVSSLLPIQTFIRDSYEVSYATATTGISSAFDLSAIFSGGTNYPQTSEVLDGTGIYHPCNQLECPRYSEAAANKLVSQQQVTRNSVDDYGNVTEVSVSTFGENLTQTVTSANTFPSSSSLNLHGQSFSYAELGRLTLSSITRSRNGESEPGKSVSFTYFTADTSTGYTGMLLSETTAATGGQDQRLVSLYEYDTFGNKAKVTATGWDGVTDISRFNKTTYDSAGRYLEATASGAYESSKGEPPEDENHSDRANNSFYTLLSSVVERNANGTATETKGLNSSISYTTYDLWGRQTRVDDAIGNWSSTQYLRCPNSTINCPLGAKTAIVERNSSSGEATIAGVVFLDLMGREIRSKTLAQEGKYIVVDKEYDKLGRAIRVAEPYFEGDGPSYWSRSYFDDLGRPFKKITPSGSKVSMVYSGLSIITENALGQLKLETKNSFGELVNVVAEDGGSIDYTYTVEGALRSTIANRSAVTEMTYAVPSSLCKPPSTNLETVLCYDTLGRKTQMWDPDKGFWQYQYNAFGELVSQTDANGDQIYNNYDARGRLSYRTDRKAGEIEASTYWYYDNEDDSGQSVPQATLQPTAVVYTKGSGTAYQYNGANYAERMIYDQHGRALSKQILLPNGEDYTTRTEYDPESSKVLVFHSVLSGLLKRKLDGVYTATEVGTRNHYDQYGFIEKITNLEDGKEIYKPTSMNARGQITEAIVGNLVTLGHDYYEATGLLRNKTAEAGLTVQSLYYEWDALANLKHRTTESSALQLSSTDPQYETFCYDSMNRLTGSYNTANAVCPVAQADQQVQYDSIGNIKSKFDVGSYQYGAAAANDARIGPHAVSAITLDNSTIANYTYDANGNMTGGKGRTFTYSSFNKPVEISIPSHTVKFEYGPSRARYYREDIQGTNTKRTWYLGNIEKIETTAGVEWRRALPSGVLHTYKTNTNYEEQLAVVKRYVLTDHLGSSNIILDHSGVPEQVLGFDVWGQRRDPKTRQNLTASALANFNSSITNRGYTGHEMIDELNIIHMNGRIYDPWLARFLQADPLIQAPTNTQSLNRYSYVWNNPLNKTDPSGYTGVEVFVVSAVIGYVFGKVAAATGVQAIGIVGSIVGCFGSGNPVACAGGMGFGTSYAATGHLGTAIKAGAISAASAWAFKVIGDKAGQASTANKNALVQPKTLGFAGLRLTPAQVGQVVLAHATVGGVSSRLQGGTFRSGFISAGLTKGSMGMLNLNPATMSTSEQVSSVLLAAALGGSFSEASGGKFANGAITAGMGQLMNNLKGGAEKELALKRFKESLGRVRSQYANPEEVGQIIDGAIADTTLGQFVSGTAGRNVPESSRYVMTKGGQWIDLTHVTSGAFNPASFFGIGEVPGIGVEIGQALRLSDSGMRLEDFYSNTVGAMATRAIEFGGVNSTPGQYLQNLLSDKLMTQSEAHEYIIGN